THDGDTSMQPARFQSAPPRGRRPEPLGDDEDRRYVSIHAPAREATLALLEHRAGWQVSIHAPAREATRPRWDSQGPRSCFNPRPRAEGDDPVDGLDQVPELVSIHAPAREATPAS